MTQERLRKAVSSVVVQAPYQAKETVLKSVSTVVLQVPSGAYIPKTVVYAVEMAKPALLVPKTVAYVVEAEITGTIPPAEVCKTVVYAVEGLIQLATSAKAVVYAVEGPDTSGNVFQDVDLERPLYRTGTPPYIEFLTDTSLKINSVFPGVHTLVIYKPDSEFEVQQVTFVSGANELPVISFNQMAVVKGVASRILIESIKKTMLDRL